MQEKIKEILDQIETVIVGKNEVMERILMAILAGGHVLMEDVPGVGKTTTAMTFARVLGLQTRRVQFTSDTMPSDIIGFSVYDKDTGKLVYKPGAVMTNLLLTRSTVPPARRSPRFWRRWKRAMSASTAKRIRCPTRLSSLQHRTPPAPPVRRCCRTRSLTVFWSS